VSIKLTRLVKEVWHVIALLKYYYVEWMNYPNLEPIFIIGLVIFFLVINILKHFSLCATADKEDI